MARHCPDFVWVVSFICTNLFNVSLTLLFLQTETPSKKRLSMNLWKKARRRRHFWTFGLSLKKHCFHQFESNQKRTHKHYTFYYKFIYIYILNVCFICVCLSYVVCVFIIDVNCFFPFFYCHVFHFFFPCLFFDVLICLC